jgi:hypothetical protein
MRKQPLPEKICLPGSCLPWLDSKIHIIYFGLELIPWRGSSSVVVADQSPALANPRSMRPPIGGVKRPIFGHFGFDQLTIKSQIGGA